MALTITGATVGYDKANTDSAIKSLHEEAVTKTIQGLESGYAELENAVDEVWVGTSAETFKQNIKTDIETIKKALEESYDTLKKEIYEIVNKMDEIDQSVISKREGN